MERLKAPNQLEAPLTPAVQEGKPVVKVTILGFNPSVRFAGGTGEMLPLEVNAAWAKKKLDEAKENRLWWRRF